jgi:glutamine amidotransferase
MKDKHTKHQPDRRRFRHGVWRKKHSTTSRGPSLNSYDGQALCAGEMFMCRFTLYLGPSIRLSKLLIEPKHSLIRQSSHSAERAEPLNGDGFGIGWYAPRFSKEPAVFHSVTPAWNNRNLAHLARVIASPCVLAHVRAATPGSVVDMSNCHPFVHGRHMFMHNGFVGGFARVRRRLLASLSDAAFSTIRGSTDTEHLFALFIDESLKSPSNDVGRDPSSALAEGLSRTIARLLVMTQEAEMSEPHYLNMAVANGTHAAICRFTNDPSSDGDSLYCLRGQLYETTADEFGQRSNEELDTPMVVSSERLTQNNSWLSVPRNHVVALTRGAAPRLFALSATGALGIQV